MSRLCNLLVACMLLIGSVFLSGAEEMTALEEQKGEQLVRGKRSMPNWNLWASDFYGWVEELRAQASYDTLQDLARTYWAHFPIASYLGYDSTPDAGQPEED
ncbi:otospiralin-like [Alosa sapidissima]|uniref:otospiralin-like n=1 Tax=Alosa sapidissima TaxID=34773 RepID=UPI001C0906AB|nr:otospiralin-like [Alosa sapidissima]